MGKNNLSAPPRNRHQKVFLADEVVEETVQELKETTPAVEEPSEDVTLVDDADLVEEQEKPLVVETAPPPQERLVRIKMAKDHVANIGGTIYDLKAGKTYRVSKDVRAILARSPLGLLDPVLD